MNTYSLVTIALYEEVNEIKRVFLNKDKNYPYRGLIKDSDGILLYPYVKKEKYNYYHNPVKSKNKVNISETAIRDKIEERMQNLYGWLAEDRFDVLWEDAFERLLV
jgi:hypothetical protein